MTEVARPQAKVVFDGPAIDRALIRMAHEIVERNKVLDDVLIIGIQSGGVPVAEALAGKFCEIGHPVALGVLDATMHRDDHKQRPTQEVRPSRFDGDVSKSRVVLVDDVLFTGRTIRAAMDALNEWGRPREIQLAVLVDRGHRELPIRPDYVGKNLPTSRTEVVRVSLDGVVILDVNEANGVNA